MKLSSSPACGQTEEPDDGTEPGGGAAVEVVSAAHTSTCPRHTGEGTWVRKPAGRESAWHERAPDQPWNRGAGTPVSGGTAQL